MTVHIDRSAAGDVPAVSRREYGTRQLVEAVYSGRLAPVGGPGGPPWTPTRQALLFDSIEAGWPVGPLVSWAPPQAVPPREVLLDGHRRVAALTKLLPGAGPALLRDLSTDRPRYLPASHAVPGGRYLPVRAMLYTMDFLAAVASPQLSGSSPQRHVAEKAANRIHRATFAIIHIRLTDPTQVAELCRRLLPDRVDPAMLQDLTTSG